VAEQAANYQPRKSIRQQSQQAAAIREQQAPLRKREKQLERDIDKINNELSKIEALLADSALYDDENKEKLTEALQQQGELKAQLADTEEAWLEVLEQLGA
jgi:ATP-binding cassette subfamily F protein 3